MWPVKLPVEGVRGGGRFLSLSVLAGRAASVLGPKLAFGCDVSMKLDACPYAM